MLDEALATVGRKEGKKPQNVVAALGRGTRVRLYERLAEAGVLRAEEGRILGIIPTRRAVLAPVLSQPGLPAPVSKTKRAALGLDPPDLVTVKERTGQGLCVLGLRFTADKGCPADRFATLRRELGATFEGIEIDSSPGNPYGIRPSAHAVLTVELVDEPGHPTRAALDRGMEFLQQRLQPEQARPADA